MSSGETIKGETPGQIMSSSPITSKNSPSLPKIDDQPWRKEMNELRGRICLIQTRIQDNEKNNGDILKLNKEEFNKLRLDNETTGSATVGVEKEMLKIRDKMDLLDGRLNLMHHNLESLIAWTGFRNDEANSYRNFQEKRNLQSVNKPLRPLKTGKAGVQVILVEENDNEGTWEPPNIIYEDDPEDDYFEDIQDTKSNMLISKVTQPSTSISNRNGNSENSKNHRLTSKFIVTHPGESMSNTNTLMEDDNTDEHMSENLDPDGKCTPVAAVIFEKNPITKKFPCLACPKEFSNRKDVVRHYRIHSGERPYSCSICHMKCIRKDQLNNHIAKKHQGEAFCVSTSNTHKSLPVVVVGNKEQVGTTNAFKTEAVEQPEPDSDPDYDPVPKPILKRGRGRPRKCPVITEPAPSNIESKSTPRLRQPKQELQKVDGSNIPTDIYSVQRNPITNKFDCSVCSKPFGNRRDMIRHMRLHTGEKPYKCKECDMSFARQDKLVGHERKVHNEGGELTPTKRKFRFHKESVEFPCDQCPEIFTNRRLALRHIAKHSAPVKHKCPSCDSSYSKKEKLNYHIKVTHGVDENTIGEIGKEKVLFDCPDCKKKFVQKKYLERHIIGCKGLRPFPCPECDKTFTQNSTLIQHRAAVHRGLKRFLCAECGKGFYTSGNYKKHMRGHRNERIYKCQLCERAFVGLSDLRSHEAIHRGIRSHQCPDCDLKFFRRYTLVRHRRVHTGEKPYMCETCGASFTQCGTLKKHKENHSLEQKEWRPPKIKGKKYRVRPQPEFPAQEIPEEPSEKEEKTEVPSSSYMVPPTHHHMTGTGNPPVLFHVPVSQSEQPHSNYETVDFVSIFSQRFGGF